MSHAYLRAMIPARGSAGFCTKMAFATRKLARQAVGQIRKAQLGLTEKAQMEKPQVYLCPHCGCWHMGHKPRGRRR